MSFMILASQDWRKGFSFLLIKHDFMAFLTQSVWIGLEF